MNPWILLMLAIVSEIIGTISLKASDGFTRLVPSILVVIGYGIAVYLMSTSLKELPLGITYAIWAGLGTAGVAVASAVLWRETFDLPRLFGIMLIIIGVVILNMYTQSHV